jgi:putative membrane protein
VPAPQRHDDHGVAEIDRRAAVAPAPAAPRRRFNARVAIVRVPANALAVALTVAVLPRIDVTANRPVLGYLVIGVVFGVLNAFVKPVLQYVALPLLLESFGFVVILVDMLLFWLLDLFFPHTLHVQGFWGYLTGGVMLGLLSFLIDNLLGLTPPIVNDRPAS